MTGQSAKAGCGPHLPSDGQKWAGRGSIHSAGETAVSRVLERRWSRGWGLSFGGRPVSRIRRAGMRGWCDCIANEGCVGRDEWLTLASSGPDIPIASSGGPEGPPSPLGPWLS